MGKFQIGDRTVTIRKTVHFELYKGYGPTADMYNIIRRFVKDKQEIGYSKWFKKDEFPFETTLQDEDFDEACNKLEFN